MFKLLCRYPLLSAFFRRSRGVGWSKSVEIIVHIGAPKTGSSAIQFFLLNNVRLLQKYNLYYPIHGLDENGISGGHSDLGVALISGDLDLARSHLDRYVQEASCRGMTLLLSAESLFPFPEYLADISARYKTVIVAFERDPYDTLLSNYNQAVKRHYAQMPFPRYCELVIAAGPDQFASTVISRWIKEFSKDSVKLISYDHAVGVERSLEKVFLSYLDIPTDAYWRFNITTKRINSSYVGPALELKRLLNSVLDRSAIELNRKIDSCLQAYSDAAPESSLQLCGSVDEALHQQLASLLGKDGNGEERNEPDCVGPCRQHITSHESACADSLPICDFREVVKLAFRGEEDIINYISSQIRQAQVSSIRSDSVSILSQIFSSDLKGST